MNSINNVFFCVAVLIFVSATSTAQEVTCDAARHQVATDCVPACPQDCENYGKVCNVQQLLCNKGCICEEGYVKDALSQDCLPINVCREYGQCGAHAEWVANPAICPAVCGSEVRCAGVSDVPGCQCQSDYVRFDDRCIKPERCPKESNSSE